MDARSSRSSPASSGDGKAGGTSRRRRLPAGLSARALLLGMSPREIDRRIESIGEFSNLGEFLDIPVRHYSQGMHLRLAFATSAAVDPEILLLDEVMAAGDVSFMESARRRMNSLME